MSSKWFVYIASAENGKLYVGISTDVQKRLKVHNSGKGSRFAIQNGELKIEYVSEALENQSLARKREIEMKGWSRALKLRLISNKNDTALL